MEESLKIQPKETNIDELILHLQNRIADLERQNSLLMESAKVHEDMEILYRAVSRQANDAFFVHDERGKFLEANDLACEKLGYTKDEILSMNVTDIEQDMSLESGLDLWAQFKPGQEFVTTGRHKCKDGTIFPVEVRFGCSIWKSKKVFLGFVRDMSERLDAEEKMNESEEKFRSFFETANVGKSITMVSGEMHVNQAFSDMLGYTREELQQKTWREITPQEDLEEIEKVLSPVLNGKKDTVRIIKRYIKKDGSLIWTDVSGRLKRDKTGKALYYIATIIDISERMKAREELETLNNELENRVKERTKQLETANHELEAFTYSVSHDLRAPLRTINSYAGLLIDDHSNELDDKAKRYLFSIKKSASRMDRLITDLLNLSQVSRSELIPEMVDMHEMAETLFYELATDEERRSFTFEIEDMPRAYCDASLIRQVWQNLIGNALKYSSRSPLKKIRIYASEDKNEITYYTKDYGAGFDENYKHKLFLAFQRLHRTDEFTGNGIGLAIVNQIISRHGGHVQATSEVGEGATFSFSLKKPNQGKRKKLQGIIEFPDMD
jgi:PAS domain S-box-containing protein